jgi:hypothetical protein
MKALADRDMIVPGVSLFRAIISISILFGSPVFALSGEVRDAITGRPIAGARVALSNGLVRSNARGKFSGNATDTLTVRAAGYRRTHMAIADGGAGLIVRLEPFQPHAIFLSLAALQDPGMVRQIAFKRSNAINALVIDVKAESGELALSGAFAFSPRDAAAAAGRAQTLKRVMRRMREDHVYTIARISVFKDDFLARSHPALAFKAEDGAPLQGRDGLRWTNPTGQSVRSYNIAVAVAAAHLGFDEIQFDYVRFPTREARSEKLPAEKLPDRRASINAFLRDARTALAPYNVFLAADVFGYASWDRGDTNIGQNLEDIAARVDYVCLMLYPSAFRSGLPSVPMPLDQPGQIVRLSLERARQRTGLPANRFRPWLQAFGDHYFDKRPFGRAEIAAQIDAADAFGADGWMLWNPRSDYDPGNLPSAQPH